jgi:hypothetical protein
MGLAVLLPFVDEMIGTIVAETSQGTMILELERSD